MTKKNEVLSEALLKLKDQKYIQELTEETFKDREIDKKVQFKSFDFIKPEYRDYVYNPKLGDDKNNSVYIAAFSFLPALGDVLYKKIFTWTFFDPMSKAYYSEIDVRSLESKQSKKEGEVFKDPVDDFLNFPFPHNLKGKCFELQKTLKHTPMFFSYVYLVNDPNLPKELLRRVWVFPYKSQIYKKIQEKLFPVGEGIEKRLNVFSVQDSPRFVLKIEASTNIRQNSMMPSYTGSYFDVETKITLEDNELSQIGYLDDMFDHQDYFSLREKFINALRKTENYNDLIEYYEKNREY